MWKKKCAAVLVTCAALGMMVVTASPAPAEAPNANATVCAVIGSMHLSNGYHVNPLVGSAGTGTFNSTVLACAGSVTGVAPMTMGLAYADPATYGGNFVAGPFLLGGNCAGKVDASRAGALFAGVVTEVNCPAGVPLPVVNGRGALLTTFVANPLTLNTCGGSTTDPVVCDVFMQGTLTFANAAA